MHEEQLAKMIVETCLLRGEFTLRSGQVSKIYFDKYRFMASPLLMRDILRRIGAMIEDHDPDVLAGLETGGIPLASGAAMIGWPSMDVGICFVRKQAKTYGTAKQIEGAEIEGKRVCVIEDVVTTGGAVFEAVEVLRAAGAQVHRVCCVIDRSSIESSEEFGYSTEAEAAFAARDLVLTSVFNLRDLSPFMEP